MYPRGILAEKTEPEEKGAFPFGVENITREQRGGQRGNQALFVQIIQAGAGRPLTARQARQTSLSPAS